MNLSSTSQVCFSLSFYSLAFTCGVAVLFYQFLMTINLLRFVKLVRRCYIFLDVKDQTEYFMEKGEIRKYIPFLKLYSSVSAFFLYIYI